MEEAVKDKKEGALYRTGEQIVIFSLENEFFGLNISHINEIMELVPLNPASRTPEFISGVINFHGHIVAVLDLARFFGLAAQRNEMVARIIVFNPVDYHIGFLVDNIREIAFVPEEDEEINPMGGKEFKNVYVERIARVEGDLVNIIDVKKLFSDLEDNFKEVDVEY